MEKINKIFNILIFVCLISIILIFIFRNCESLLYNKNTEGKNIENYDEYSSIKLALDTYIMGYIDFDIETLKKCTNIFKQLEDDEYKAIYSKYFENGFEKIVVHNIEKCFGDVYIVQYSLNMNTSNSTFEAPELHKLILKINKYQDEFIVYYDGLKDEM